MSGVDQQLYQQLILEHNRKPRNFGKLEGASHAAEGYNPLCGDHYHVYLMVNDDGIVERVNFEGHGCAISKASASLMTESVKGKNIDDARVLFDEFRELLAERLGKLKIFAGIWKFPARVKCAALSWHAMHAALENKAQVSTE
jgi:nitrogen fixation NifU-like protein